VSAVIDVKRAILIAKEKAAEMLEQPSNLEEIERDSYKGHDVWSITLSVPAQLPVMPNSVFAQLVGGKVEYKRFLIDVETGELVAMKLREVASQ
jgi:hypothetical protein